MITPTDAPLYAFRNNVVVSASAGTGKTFRLVTLYTLLTLGLTSMGAASEDDAGDPVSPTRIAATTFSRAAAAEIRERVERLLRAIASHTSENDGELSAYRAVLDQRADQTGAPPTRSPVMRQRAAQALIELPHALIDTLHGLAGRVVRASALELGMSPGFVVLDEEQARASTDAAIEEVLTAALAARSAAALHLLDAAGGLAMGRQRIADLLDRADEEGVGVAELGCTDFLADARASSEQLSRICRALLAESSKTFAEPAEAVLRALEQWTNSGELPAGSSEAFERLFSGRARAKPLPSEEAFVELRETIRGDNHAHRARRLVAFFDSAPELTPRTVAVGGLLAAVAARRAELRQRASSLGFGDLLRTARNALRDRADLATSARAMWDVLLVDEFQDTSRVQRDLVYLLREGAPSAARRPAGALPRAADLARSGLLIVGDRKQSIYGFRGADVTVFTRVAVELAGEHARQALALGRGFPAPQDANAAFVSLSENRRSVPDVLAFVNAFAAQDFATSSPRAFDITYAASEHLHAVGSTAAAHPPGDGAPPQPDRAWPHPVVVVDDGGEQPPNAPPIVRGATGAMREALVAAALIAREVAGSSGALRFADFAVLTRRRSTLPLLEFALARLNVPYLVAGRGLYDTREVRDLFAVLRMLVDPFDRDALAVVMRGPALALSDASLARLAKPGVGLAMPEDWWRGEPAPASGLSPDERQRLARFHERTTSLARTCAGLAPADALRHVTRELELDQVMAALPHPAQRFANVERLVAIASASQTGGSVPAFVRWLDRQIADEADESESAVLSVDDDAVRLMTIHASKGLEFRAVVAVDLGAAPRTSPVTLAIRPGDGERAATLVVRHTQPEGPSLYTPEAMAFSRESLARDLAERKRLTYVAFTRARERLFLVAPPAPPVGSAAATLRRMLGEGDLPATATTSAATLLTSDGAAVAMHDDHTTPDGLAHERTRAGLVHGDGTTRPGVDGDHRPVDVVLEPAAVGHARLQGRSSARSARSAEAGLLSISTTPLVTFDECPRRYRLVHELAQEAPLFARSAATHADTARPLSTDDRRRTGSAAHRVLETLPLELWGTAVPVKGLVERLSAEGLAADAPILAELAQRIAVFVNGDYAREVRARAVAVRREEPFVLEIASASGSLSLRGAIDLLVFYADGSADVIDYKSSWRRSDDVPFQLRAYALAARRHFGATAVRAGIVDLAARSAVDPQLARVGDEELAAFELRLSLLRSRFLQCRSADDFPGVEVARCRALRCGFVVACHPDAPA